MPDTQATPNTDDKISALEALVTKLAHKVDNMVSHRAMRRADSARGDDRRDDDRRDDDDDKRDDARSDDDDKAKKDAARNTLFGGKRKDAKRDDDDKRDDARRDDEDEEEEEKEAKGDDDKRDDADDPDDEKKSEPEPMASDDDRRKDRKDAKRDDSGRSDRRRDDDDRRDARSDDKRDDSRSDDRRDDDRRDDRRDDSRSDDRRDDSRADSMIRSLKRELDDLRRSMRRPRAMSDDELNALSERQTEWDRVAQMHGQRASRPLDGERIESYDRRMAKVFQKHSDKWKDTNLADMPIEVVTRVIAPEIRADSMKAAYKSDPSPGAMQREIIKTDRTGRRISEFIGPVDAANGMFKPFELPPMRFRGFNRHPNQF